MSKIFYDLILLASEKFCNFCKIFVIVYYLELWDRRLSQLQNLSIYQFLFFVIFVNLFNFVNLKYINIEYQYWMMCCLHFFSNLSNIQIVTFSKVPYFSCHVYFCLLSSQLIQLQRKLVIFLKHGKKFLEAFIVSVPTKRIQKILKKKRSRHVLKFQA